MPIIQLPDGNSVNVPDDAPPEVHAQIRAKIQQQSAASGQPAPPQSLWEMAKGLGSDVARGAGKALTGMMEGAAAFNDTQSRFDTSKRGYNELTQKVEQQLPTPQGDSTSRQYVRAGLEGLGGAMTTGIPSVMGAISGVGGGLGGEAGKRLGGAPGQFIGSLAGGAGAGVAAGVASRARPQSAALAKEALEGFSPQEFEAAQAFMNKTKAAGTDIDLAQALHAVTGREGNLTSLRNAIAGRRQGDTVQQTLNRQPEQLSREAELTYAGLPGKNYGPTQSANNLQETATSALEQAKRARTALWNQEASAGTIKTVPTPALQKVQDKLTSLAEQYPNSAQSAELEGLRAKLLTPDGYLSEPAAINRIFTEFTNRLKSPTLRDSGVDAGTSKYLGKVVNELRDDLGEAFEPIRKANTAYRDYTQSVVAPLKQGPVGVLAQPAGYNPETGAVVGKLQGLLHRGSDPRSQVSDLRTVTRELGKVDPNAIDDALKSHVSTQISKAMDSPRMPGEAPTNPDMAKRLYAGLFKDDMQWQGLKDVMVESANVKGADPTDVIRGMENLKQITHAMTSRPAAGGGLSGEDIKRLGGSSNTANVVRIASFLPANRAGEMIERATLGHTLSQFDAILTSPEGVKMLQELGRVPVMSKKAQVILGTYGASLGNPPGLSDYNPPE